MKENDIVTIVIPSYNHENYIEQAIRSVIGQTYQNIQLILVDDHSPDATCEVIERLLPECRKRFSAVEFVAKKGNSGIQDSLNTALDLAIGDFIMPMASDDLLKENSIEVLYAFMKTHPEFALAGGDCELINDQCQRVFWDEKTNCTNEMQATFKTYAQFMQHYHPHIDFLSDEYGSYQSLLHSNYIPNGYLMRRAAIIEAGKYNHRGFEDWHMHLQLAKKYKLKFIDKILFSYRWHEDNTMKTIDTAAKSKETIALEKEYCMAHELGEVWQNVFNDLCGIPRDIPPTPKQKRSFLMRVKKEVSRLTKRFKTR